MDFHHWRINAKALNHWLKQTGPTMDWLADHNIHFEAVKTAFIDGTRIGTCIKAAMALY